MIDLEQRVFEFAEERGMLLWHEDGMYRCVLAPHKRSVHGFRTIEELAEWFDEWAIGTVTWRVPGWYSPEPPKTVPYDKDAPF